MKIDFKTDDPVIERAVWMEVQPPNHQPYTLNPKPGILNPKPNPPNPKPQTHNLKT